MSGILKTGFKNEFVSINGKISMESRRFIIGGTMLPRTWEEQKILEANSKPPSHADVSWTDVEAVLDKLGVRSTLDVSPRGHSSHFVHVDECAYMGGPEYSGTMQELTDRVNNHHWKYDKVITYKYRHIITKKILEDTNDLIPNIFSCYPPNVVVVVGKRVKFYHGLEEGLMCWDSIDKRRLKKEINKKRKESTKHFRKVMQYHLGLDSCR